MIAVKAGMTMNPLVSPLEGLRMLKMHVQNGSRTPIGILRRKNMQKTPRLQKGHLASIRQTNLSGRRLCRVQPQAIEFSTVKNSQHHIWPLLSRAINTRSYAFIVVLFYSSSKLRSILEFLRNAEIESGGLPSHSMQLLQLGGAGCLSVRGRCRYASLQLRQTGQQRRGYPSCFRCTIINSSPNHCMTLPNHLGCPRTDTAFCARSQQENQTGCSPFEKLFPISYVDGICLRPTMRFLSIW